METKEYKLTDICDFQGGTQPPKEEWINEPREGYVRMLQIRDFTQGKEEHVAYVKDTKKLNKCKSDDILIGRYGASVGKILTGLEGAYNVAIIKTIPNEELLSRRYLYFVLTGTDFQNFILNIGARAAQAGFNKNDLSLFKLHIPTSIEDQERIASVLEKTQSLISKREKSIGLLDEFLKMKFLETFGDPILNEKGWEIKSGEEYCENISVGVVIQPATHYVEQGVIALRSLNIKPNRIDLKDIVFFSKESHSTVLSKSILRKGDVVLVRTGKTGTAAVIPSELDGCNCIDLIIARPNIKIIDPFYLSYFFNSERAKALVLSNEVGGIQKHFNIGAIRALEIPIPPLSLQMKFSSLVNQIDILRGQYQISLAKFNDLYDAFSHKALKGELEIINRILIDATIKVDPKISGEIIAIDKINKELEEFHKNQPHTGAPDKIDNTIRQLEAELKIKGEIPFWDEYVKYRIVKGKFKEAFTFDQLWQEISKFPFETLPEYDEVATMLFRWLEEENSFIKQKFNETTKQIELIVDEAAAT
ncbi:MAG: restriction endonuclease subunit S [Cyclobacteriaceae bacterium]|nr:restriction endonuclease subunit S [Cyclobacteriaceae bacterium]